MEIEREKLEAIAAKIEKLLRLSASPNEHEAALAAAKAQELLETYNLDMFMVEKAKKATGKREDTRLNGGLYKWQRAVWRGVSELNFCMYWSIKGLTKGSKYEHRVLGRSVNILSTRLMAEYLEGAIERLAREHVAGDPRYYFTKAAIAFREGLADRIVERLNDRRWEQREAARRVKEADPTSTALTVRDVEEAETDANNDFLYGEGWSARRRERWAKQLEEYQRLEAERKAEDEAFKRDHPREWARREAERVKRQEANARKWGRRSFKVKGPRHESYHDGYAKGDEVSLDQQVDHTPTKQIGG